MTRKKSFWASMPGVMTAVASLVTAITGLLVVLYWVSHQGTGELPPHPSLPSVPSPPAASQPAASQPAAPPPRAAPPPQPVAAAKEIMVRVEAEKPYVKRGDDIDLRVVVLSQDDGAFLPQCQVTLTATCGYFSPSRAPQVSGFTDSHGVFKVEWVAAKKEFPKGMHRVEFEAVASHGKARAQGKTAISVTAH